MSSQTIKQYIVSSTATKEGYSFIKEKDVGGGSQASLQQERQAYQNTTCSTHKPEDGLCGSPQLPLLITGVIEQEVGPLVQLDD